jgi:TPR repeat protein
MLLAPCLGAGGDLDDIMRGHLLRLRPYLFGGLLSVILAMDLSNQWEVPIRLIPREFFERYVDGFNPHAEPAALLALAEKDNVQAQYVYALRHTAYAPVELQIKEDRELAFHWTLKAADGGHSRAMAVVALYYFRGTGTAKNLKEAKNWADQAVTKGQSMGFRVLGDLRREEARALKAASATADNKKALADYETAMKEAFAYYRRGADAGERIALRMMSEGHDEGVPGMPRNYELGTEFLRRSAMRRDLTAIRALAERLEKGVRAPRDLSQAYAWRLVLSQLTGVDKDTAELARLEGTMGLPEIQRGQEAAAKILAELPSEAADALSRLHTSR